MITMQQVCKSYRIAKRNAGFGEACKALFHREYETVHALRDVSFTINDGEMVGYIGPNGAGKSSTIKILSGILTPDSGTVLVEGKDVNEQNAQAAGFYARMGFRVVSHSETDPSGRPYPILHLSL